MASQDYLTDVTCYRSLSALRDMIYYNKTTPVQAVSAVKKSTTTGSKNKRMNIDLSTFRNDKSVILAIQNDVRFINIIMNCKKQRSPIIYMFVEPGQFISCVIKNANGYPMMFIRIPIDNVFAYAASGASNVYEFPLTQLLSKDIKFTKNNSYLLTFRHDNQNVNFEYEMYQGDSAPNKITMQNVGSHSNEVINTMFNDRFGMTNQKYGYLANGTELCSNFLMAFYDMSIMMVREVSDVSNFIQLSQKQTTHSKNYLQMDAETFSFINECPNRRDVKYISSKSDSLIWNGRRIGETSGNEFTTMMTEAAEEKKVRKFNLVTFECLFKNTYNKSITNSDKLYYIFGSYLGNFLFIKMVTALDIDLMHVEDNRLNKIFQKGYQIMDCYMCEESFD